ncbi:MAG: alpha-D-ribose 1-methylphosphonate 5-triphosphate diphosphatase [Acetobacteraceae bacterium]|nr:alpha-D-ribose 1-methylphosphonate 5-triphosphate diphosphatase [Acetobacteraceae bacterium]
MRKLRIKGGRVLLGDEGLADADIVVSDGRIGPIGAGGDALTLDATDLLVLPGIVDIHGDAFERQLQPRPGVGFAAQIALADTESQLLANGITTAFHGVTLSWEPGLRSLESWRALQAALVAERWVCDMRIHLRWEAFNLDALDAAVADITAGRVHLLAFNDHTPSILKKIKDPVQGAKYSDRAGMSLADFSTLAARIAARADAVPAALDMLSAAARAAGIPMASHDDAHVDVRARFRERGARICEFPIAEEVGHAARAAGDWVVMGSPNVVRGKSHLGWASAAVLAEAGICSILSSDYFYPAMLRAAFVMAERGMFDLTRVWALISTNPAAAAGLDDRGSIDEGKRADVLLVDPRARRIVATVAGGKLAYLSAAGAVRLG